MNFNSIRQSHHLPIGIQSPLSSNCLAAIASILVLLISGSCNSGHYVRQGFVADLGSGVEIPLIVNRDLVYINVTISGADHLFMFDTGSSITIIDSSRITGTGDDREMSITDAHGNRKDIQRVIIPEIVIGDTYFAETRAIVTDLSWFPVNDTIEGISGILGSPVISKVAWDLDIERGVLTIRDTCRSAGALTESLIYDDELEPHIEVTIDRASGLFEIDTGSPIGYSIPQGHEIWKTVDTAGARRVISTQGSVNSIVIDTMYRVDGVDVLLGDSLVRKDATLTMRQAGKARVGAEVLLSLKNVCLDSRRQSLLIY